MSEMEALRGLVCPEDDDDQHVYGSALNASSAASRSDKELAKPGVKMEVKTFNRAAEGGAPEEQIKAAQEAKSLAERLSAPENVIWTPEEVQEAAEEMPDDRMQPDFEIIPKQHVGTEDVFLGLSDRDASSTHCDSILVKIWLPNTQFKNVELDIKNQAVVVQSPNFYLNKLLPFNVDKTKGKAKFDSDKFILEVTLPVVKLEIMDRLMEDARRFEHSMNAEAEQFADQRRN